MAVNPSQAQQATNTIQVQVASLKNNALRLPKPFSDMMLQAAGAFESDVANTTYARLAQAFNNQVYPPCRDLAAADTVGEGESEEVPLTDFGRLFRPHRYSTASSVETSLPMQTPPSGTEYRRQDNPVARLMSPRHCGNSSAPPRSGTLFSRPAATFLASALAMTSPDNGSGFRGEVRNRRRRGNVFQPGQSGSDVDPVARRRWSHRDLARNGSTDPGRATLGNFQDRPMGPVPAARLPASVSPRSMDSPQVSSSVGATSSSRSAQAPSTIRCCCRRCESSSVQRRCEGPCNAACMVSFRHGETS